MLTGFKYIGEAIGELERFERQGDFVFGFEESCGYLSGTYVRDKDAVNACSLVAEMADYYAEQGKTLRDVLRELFMTYGYYHSKQLNYTFEGLKGTRKIARFMTEMRYGAPQEICGIPILKKIDYLEDPTGLPKENVLEFDFADGKVIIRPSGTEPKLKVYLSYCLKSDDERGILPELEAYFNEQFAKR